MSDASSDELGAMTVQGDALVRRLVTLMEGELDGEIVGLQVDQGACYGFNITASAVWRLLERPIRKAEIENALLAAFDVEPEVCRAELDQLLETLEQRGLVAIQWPLP